MLIFFSSVDLLAFAAPPAPKSSTTTTWTSGRTTSASSTREILHETFHPSVRRPRSASTATSLTPPGMLSSTPASPSAARSVRCLTRRITFPISTKSVGTSYKITVKLETSNRGWRTTWRCRPTWSVSSASTAATTCTLRPRKTARTTSSRSTRPSRTQRSIWTTSAGSACSATSTRPWRTWSSTWRKSTPSWSPSATTTMTRRRRGRTRKRRRQMWVPN